MKDVFVLWANSVVDVSSLSEILNSLADTLQFLTFSDETLWRTGTYLILTLKWTVIRNKLEMSSVEFLRLSVFSSPKLLYPPRSNLASLWQTCQRFCSPRTTSTFSRLVCNSNDHPLKDKCYKLSHFKTLLVLQWTKTGKNDLHRHVKGNLFLVRCQKIRGNEHWCLIMFQSENWDWKSCVCVCVCTTSVCCFLFFLNIFPALVIPSVAKKRFLKSFLLF